MGFVNGEDANRSTGKISRISNVLPLVEFTYQNATSFSSHDNDNQGGTHTGKILIPIAEETWSLTLSGSELAWRHQLPIALAWGISVHKAQGMQISLLDISFDGMFEHGQAYVALSRATSLEGLRLQNFRPNLVKANQVYDFYSHYKQ